MMQHRQKDSFISIKDDFFGISQVAIKTDIYETKDGIVILLEIPGVPKDEIKLFSDHGKIIVSGLKKERMTDVRYFQVERQFGNFSHVIELPPTVNLEKIVAEHDAGILKIIIPWLIKSKMKLLTRVEIK